MSGGHFDYNQYHLSTIADDIEQVIRENKDYYNYKPETIKEFEKAIELLKTAQIYVQRIDYLISGDDGEDTFHKRLLEELTNEKH